MFSKTSGMKNELLLALAMPVLAAGWLLLVAGAYHLAMAVFQAAGENETGLLAFWELAFSFGAISIATLIGDRAGFLAKLKVRRLFLFSQIAASVLFLGYLGFALVSAFAQSGGSGLWR